MKYCYHCGHLTPGEAVFCNSCGRSYDVKLCPRLHANPRSAEVCSQCGNRDLSTPQPRVPLWSRCFEFLLRAVVLILFVYLGAAFLVVLLKGILASPRAQSALLVFGISALVLLGLWNKLPQWIRRLIRRSIGRKEHGSGR